MCVHLLVKNLRLFNQEIFYQCEVFFLNLLETKCNSVRKRVKNAFSRTLLHLVFKIFKKKKITLIKSTKYNNLRFFLQKNAHIFQKQVICDRKLFKLQPYGSVTLHVSHKTPISDGSKKVTYIKMQILPQHFFPD